MSFDRSKLFTGLLGMLIIVLFGVLVVAVNAGPAQTTPVSTNAKYMTVSNTNAVSSDAMQRDEYGSIIIPPHSSDMAFAHNWSGHYLGSDSGELYISYTYNYRLPRDSNGHYPVDYLAGRILRKPVVDYSYDPSIPAQSGIWYITNDNKMHITLFNIDGSIWYDADTSHYWDTAGTNTLWLWGWVYTWNSAEDRY